MWRLLKHALFARATLPLLGAVPVNVVGLVCFGVLGIANPGFWFLGAGLEGAYLFALISNPRFRKWSRAQDFTMDAASEQVETRARLQRLDDARRRRYAAIEQRIAQVAQTYRDRDIEQFLVESNLGALDKLRSLYLDLLLADQGLRATESSQIETQVRHQIAELERELAARLAPPVRESKSATLAVLKKRLVSVGRRRQTLEEIESDLERIEAQVELAVENALIEGKPQVISTSIELVSHLLDGSPEFSFESDLEGAAPSLPTPLAAPTPAPSEPQAPPIPPRKLERNE